MLDPRERPLAKLPEWLPPGWAMEVRERSSGLKDKYYIDPMYGHKFRSQKEVFRYLGWDVDAWKKKKLSSQAHLGGDVEGPMNEPSVGSLVLVAQDIVDVGKSIDWLPLDWKVELRQRKGDFRVDKYYIDPTNRYKFRSKIEVFRHLGLANEKNTSAPIAQDISVTVEKLPNWLPLDWRVEIKERKNGSKAKCYIDTRNGYKFYSKREVLRHLGIGEIATTETLPDWLPLTWRVEVKEKKSGKKYKKYVDPVSGRKFYTKREVSHYLENGEFRKPSNRRGRKKKRGVQNAESVCPGISLYTEGRTQKLGCSSTRRCLFTGQSSNTNETKNDEFECKSAIAAIPLTFRDSECKQNNIVCVDNRYDQPFSVVLPEGHPVHNSVRKLGKRKSESELYEPRNCKNLSLPHRTSRRLAGLPPESAPETTKGNHAPPSVVAVAEMETGEVEHYLGIEDQSHMFGKGFEKAEVETVQVEHCIGIEDQSDKIGKVEVETREVEHSHVTEDQSNKVGKDFKEAEVEHLIVIKDQSNNVGKAFEKAKVETGEVKHCISIDDQSNKLGKAGVDTGEDEHSLVIEDQSNKFRIAFKKAGVETLEVEHCIAIEDQTNKLGKAEVETGEAVHFLVTEDQSNEVGKHFEKAGVETLEVAHCIVIEDQTNKLGKAEVETGEAEHFLVTEDQSNKVGKHFKKTREVEHFIAIEDQSNKLRKAEVETGEVEHSIGIGDQSNKLGKAEVETGEVVHFIGIKEQSNKVGKPLEDLGGPEEHRKKKLAPEVSGSKVFFSFGGVPLFDPCIEFAFKTLTGAIPLEDNLPNHQHHSSASTPSTSGFGLPDLNAKTLL